MVDDDLLIDPFDTFTNNRKVIRTVPLSLLLYLLFKIVDGMAVF